MPTKWYNKATVQAAIVNAVPALLVFIIAALVLEERNKYILKLVLFDLLFVEEPRT